MFWILLDGKNVEPQDLVLNKLHKLQLATIPALAT